jgi:putative serine protease PepD
LRIVPLVIALVLAAIVGGIAGGLIVRATWGSGNGSSTDETAAACPAATVAGDALPSVVTIRAAGGGRAAAARGSSSGRAATS